VFRILIETGFTPSSPLEFHFYSAEESGLLGSEKIAAAYKKASVPVK
jgi:leucyl aminopeptidase